MVWDPATSTYQQVSEVPVNGAGWEAPAYRTAEMPTVGRYPAGVATEAGYPPPQPDYANGLQPAPTPVQAPQPYPAQQPGPVPNQLPSPPADPVPWSDPAGGQAGLQSAPAVGQAPVDPWANGAGYAHPTTEQPVHANGQPRMYYPEPAPGNGQAPVHQQSPAAGPAGWPSQAHEDAYAAPAMPQPAAVQAAPGASNGYANGFAEQSSGLHQPPYANGYGQPDQDAAGHVDQPSGNYPPQPFPAQSPPYGSHPQSAAPIAPVEGQAAPPQSWPEPPPPAGLTEPAWVPPAPPPGDQWVAVDPSAFSNPYTESPVYTSGPQPVQTAPPPAYYAPQPQQPDPLVVPVPVGHVPYQGLQQPPFPPPAGPEPGPVAEAGRSADDTYRPEQGELGIKERRSWKTWQLLVAVLVAAVVGMAINGATGSSSSAGAGSNSSAAGGSGGGYKLPPPSSGAVTTTMRSMRRRQSASTVSCSPRRRASRSTSKMSADSTTATAAGSRLKTVSIQRCCAAMTAGCTMALRSLRRPP